MRLIDADKAKFFIADVLDAFKVPVGDRMADRLLKTIDALPTVDAVEVVRCKDCKYYNPELQRCNHPCLDYDVECFDHWIDTEPDGFCSYGKKGERA